MKGKGLLLSSLGTLLSLGLVLAAKGAYGAAGDAAEVDAAAPAGYELVTSENLGEISVGAQLILGAEEDPFLGYTGTDSDWGRMGEGSNEWAIFIVESVDLSSYSIVASYDSSTYITPNSDSTNFKVSSNESSLYIDAEGKIHSESDYSSSRYLGYNSSGSGGLRWYADDEHISSHGKFYSVSTTPIPDDVKPVSIALSAGEGKLSYYAGDEFDPTGFEVSLTYGSESDPSYASTSSLEVDDSHLTWNYDLTTVGEGKELTVTFNEDDIELTSNALTYDVLEAPDGQSYYFGEHTDFLNDWTTSYEQRTLAYTGEFSITFASADKQSQTITDMPVSKGNEATLTSEKPMSKIEFGFKQWGSKSNTASLYIDGGSTAVDSADFLDGVSTVSYVSDSPFSTAKVDWSSDKNQVGWNYVYIEYASVEPSQAESYAETFLELMTCDGEGAITAEEGTWETLSDLYAGLSDSDKGILKEATANKDSESRVEQAVARYDYIVGKYGVEQYPDFMDRTPARIAEARSVEVNDQTAAWVIAGISAAGIASAAAFFFLRRRKEA